MNAGEPLNSAISAAARMPNDLDVRRDHGINVSQLPHDLKFSCGGAAFLVSPATNSAMRFCRSE